MRDLPSSSPPHGTRRPRWGIAGLVLLIHVALVAGLIRAFTPEFAAQAVRAVTQAFSVELEADPVPPVQPVSPEKPAPAGPPDRGTAGKAGPAARPRDMAAPKAPFAVNPTPAPPVTGRGEAELSGAATGEGAGGASVGAGAGAGSGGSGTGGGGGLASPTVKISGEISSAKDYSRKTRDLRIGASVTIDLAVGPDGKVTGCRIVRASPDAEADAVTCRLAQQRFRFRPARDDTGAPVGAVFRWRQRWFY